MTNKPQLSAEDEEILLQVRLNRKGKKLANDISNLIAAACKDLYVDVERPKIGSFIFDALTCVVANAMMQIVKENMRKDFIKEFTDNVLCAIEEFEAENE